MYPGARTGSFFFPFKLVYLVLIALAVWLAHRKKAKLICYSTGIFMMVTTLASLWQLLFNNYLPAKNYPLEIIAILHMLMSAGVIVLAIQKIVSINKGSAAKVT